MRDVKSLGWQACAVCGHRVVPLAAACPSCGMPFQKKGVSIVAAVLAILCWLGAVVTWAGAASIMQQTFGAVLGLTGLVLWLCWRRTDRIADAMVPYVPGGNP